MREYVKNLFHRRPRRLALSITPEEVKLAWYPSGGVAERRPLLHRAKLPPSCISATTGGVTDADALRFAIRTLCKPVEARSCPIALAIPMAGCLLSHMELSTAPATGLRDEVAQQLQGEISCDLDQLSIDFETYRPDSRGKLGVVAVAARRALIAAYCDVIRSSGHRIVMVTPGMIASMNYSRIHGGSPLSRVILLVSLGRVYTELSIWRDGVAQHVETVLTPDCQRTLLLRWSEVYNHAGGAVADGYKDSGRVTVLVKGDAALRETLESEFSHAWSQGSEHVDTIRRAHGMPPSLQTALTVGDGVFDDVLGLWEIGGLARW